MTNENDSVKNKHLESTAAAVKRYVLSEISGVTNAVINDLTNIASGTVLSTTPATVDGGIWYETTSTAPIVKIYSGGSKYYLYTNQLVSPNLSLSSAAVTVASGASQTITLSHSGNGVVSLSNPNTSALTAAYNSSSKVITLTNNNVSSTAATVNVGISLTESGTYAADSKTLAVTCQSAPVSPNLTVSPSSFELPVGGSQTVSVSYNGNGTISYSKSDSNADVSYNSSTKKLTISYSSYTMTVPTFTVTVNLSASDGYTAASKTITVSSGPNIN